MLKSEFCSEMAKFVFQCRAVCVDWSSGLFLSVSLLQ